MANLSFETLSFWESVTDFQERYVLSRFDSGEDKAVAWLCADHLIVQKALFNEKIAKIALPCLPYLAGIIGCESEIQEQIETVFEVQAALRQNDLEKEDAMGIIKSKCEIIPIAECTVGIQASLYFSAGGTRPSITIRTLRKSGTSGRLYFGKEGKY